jgi:hypothetical protein
MTSGSNCRHLNRPQTEGARMSIRPAYHGVTTKLQHFRTAQATSKAPQKCSGEYQILRGANWYKGRASPGCKAVPARRTDRKEAGFCVRAWPAQRLLGQGQVDIVTSTRKAVKSTGQKCNMPCGEVHFVRSIICRLAHCSVSVLLTPYPPG